MVPFDRIILIIIIIRNFQPQTESFTFSPSPKKSNKERVQKTANLHAGKPKGEN